MGDKFNSNRYDKFAQFRPCTTEFSSNRYACSRILLKKYLVLMKVNVTIIKKRNKEN